MDNDSAVVERGLSDPHARKGREWYLLSSHGIVYFYVAAHPDCTTKQISEGLYLSRRTVWGLIGDLRRSDMIEVRRVGRRHHYTAKLDAGLHHPAFADRTMRDMIEFLAAGEPDSRPIQAGKELTGQ